MDTSLTSVLKAVLFILLTVFVYYLLGVKTIWVKASGFVYYDERPIGNVRIKIVKDYEPEENLNSFSIPDTGNYFLNFNALENTIVHFEYSKKNFTTLRRDYLPKEHLPDTVDNLDTIFLFLLPTPLSNNYRIPRQPQSLSYGSSVLQLYNDLKQLSDTIHLNNIRYFTSIIPKEKFTSPRGKDLVVSEGARWYKIICKTETRKEKMTGWILYDPAKLARP